MNDALRQTALRLLARREHSRFELEQKLAMRANPDEVSQVIDHLLNTGLLSDARFSESYVRSHAARFGAAKIRSVLRRKGVNDELVRATLAQAELPDEMERARALWARKFGKLPHDAREWARQARFLQGRGFAAEIIRRMLKDPEACQ